MQQSTRKALLCILISLEFLWTLNILSIYYSPVVTLYEFERPYHVVSHVVEIPALRSAAILQEDALTMAHLQNTPYATISVAALILAVLSIVFFPRRGLRRVCWGSSLLLLSFMFLYLNYAS